MVQVKIKHIVFMLTCMLLGACNMSTQRVNDLKGDVVVEHPLELDRYCFSFIRDSLEEKINIKSNKIYTIEYSKFRKTRNKNSFKKFDEFIEFSSDVEFFLIETNDEHLLVLIGKALGVTGVGDDYWNYCFGKLDTEKRYEFGSLAKSPFSIFIDELGNLKYIELMDNYPRPANGSVINLDHFPVVVSVYDVNNQLDISFDFECRN